MHRNMYSSLTISIRYPVWRILVGSTHPCATKTKIMKNQRMAAHPWNCWYSDMEWHPRSRKIEIYRNVRIEVMLMLVRGKCILPSICLAFVLVDCWCRPSKLRYPLLYILAQLHPNPTTAAPRNCQIEYMAIMNNQDCRLDQNSYQCNGMFIVFMWMLYHFLRKIMGHW